MSKICIVGGARTPIGSFGGSLSSVPATELGSIAIKGALEKAGVPASMVEACYMGNVCSGNLGQAPARQAALRAGLPESCTCTTVNKVCASGLKAITMAAQDIYMGIVDVAVAGGMENMSSVPYYIAKARFGHRMGNGELVDGLVHDGLIDPFVDKHMGLHAEACAKKYGLSREEQDAYARQSYERAMEAWRSGRFDDEVVAVKLTSKGKETCVEKDEECFRIPIDSLSSLKPAFIKDGSGTITSGNASGLNDGAAAVVLMSEAAARKMGVTELIYMHGWADAEQSPADFTTAPAVAIPKALAMARVRADDVDVYEVNEAFAVVALANCAILRLKRDAVNVNGGGVSIGHPLGCSGARIVVTLINVLRQRNGDTGVAGICNGGGGSTAVVIGRKQGDRTPAAAL